MRFFSYLFPLLLVTLWTVFTAEAQQIPVDKQNIALADTLDDNPSDEEILENISAEIHSSAMPAILNVFPVTKYYATWQTKYVRTAVRGMEGVEEDTVRLVLLPNDSSRFVMPRLGEFLSPFGKRGRRIHTGVDIRLNHGDSVGCAFDGVVRFSDICSGYGICVVVRHNNGLETVYAHLSKSLVEPNQIIKAGEVLGLGGRTGRASCNHLHFETRFREEAFNPKQLINFETNQLVSDTLLLMRKSFGYSRDYMPGMDYVTRNEALAKNTATDKKAGSSAQGAKKYYTVKQGDTLYSLAKRNGTTVDNLCKLNGISPKTTLKLGRKLRVK